MTATEKHIYKFMKLAERKVSKSNMVLPRCTMVESFVFRHDISMARYHGYQTFAMILSWFYDMAGNAR